MDQYGLYKKVCDSIFPFPEIEIKVFKPSFQKPFFWLNMGITVSIKERLNFLCIEFLWALASGFRYKLYYILDENKVVHTSFCIYSCFKFPFMKTRECVQIGPCRTDSLYRGRNYYPAVIDCICKSEVGKTVYMIIRDANIPSINGAHKAGLKKIANLQKSHHLKIYTIKERI